MDQFEELDFPEDFEYPRNWEELSPEIRRQYVMAAHVVKHMDGKLIGPLSEFERKITLASRAYAVGQMCMIRVSPEMAENVQDFQSNDDVDGSDDIECMDTQHYDRSNTKRYRDDSPDSSLGTCRKISKTQVTRESDIANRKEALNSAPHGGSANGDAKSRTSKTANQISENTSQDEEIMDSESNNLGITKNNEESSEFILPKIRVRIPPIIISETNKECNFKKLNEAIQAKIGHSDYACRCLADGKIKIQIKSVEEFRDIQRLLREQSIFFHTNLPSTDIPFKYLIKGIHPSISVQEIIEELESMEFTVERATRMLRRDKTPTTMVILQLPKSEENKRIFEISKLMSSSIKIERLKKPTKPTICYRCSQYFHTASNCNNPPKCGKCSGPHTSADCTQKFWGDKAKCPNCHGNHVSNFSGCPKNPANIQKAKNQSQASRPSSNLPQEAKGRPQPATSYAEKTKSKPQSGIQEDTVTRLENLLVQMASELRNVNLKVSSLAAEVNQLKKRHG